VFTNGAENILPLCYVVNDVIFLIVGGMCSQMGAENILPLRDVVNDVTRPKKSLQFS
jgi:hypothetical protein